MPGLLTPTKSLTLLMKADRGDEQADIDIAAIQEGTTNIIVRQNMEESYFHQLRYHVAKDPSLADRIQVLYEDYDGTIKEIGLTKDRMFGPNGWPKSFSKKLWDIELNISKANFDKENNNETVKI